MLMIKAAESFILFEPNDPSLMHRQPFNPVLVQDGDETDLRKVEHIKLAKPKRSL